MPTPPKNLRSFQSLVQVIEALRGPEGCPWDKEQTHMSLIRFAIEEASELAEAIQLENPEDIKNELGDLLLQVVLHAEIARQNKSFEIHDIIEALNKKMIRRHPHVFADTKVSNSEDVSKNWDHIKALEKKTSSSQNFTFDLPSGLPALLASFKIGEKTKKHNFDWKEVSSVIDKVKEELCEFETALKKESKDRTEEELGDLLFSLAQVSRHLGIDPEQCLRKSNKKFEGRFSKLMSAVQSSGREMTDLTPEELESIWQQIKK